MDSMVGEYLNNQFLVAMPGMLDPNFAKGVTFLCEHNDQGAMGIIVNHPGQLVLGDVLNQLDIDEVPSAVMQQPVYRGGPVGTERGFVLHSPPGEWESSFQINENLCLTTSQDILIAIAHSQGPEHYLVALGYAGWSPGQLESEIKQNAWLSAPASSDIVFKTPVEERWSRAAELLGVDLSTIATNFGNA